MNRKERRDLKFGRTHSSQEERNRLIRLQAESGLHVLHGWSNKYKAIMPVDLSEDLRGNCINGEALSTADCSGCTYSCFTREVCSILCFGHPLNPRNSNS